VSERAITLWRLERRANEVKDKRSSRSLGGLVVNGERSDPAGPLLSAFLPFSLLVAIQYLTRSLTLCIYNHDCCGFRYANGLFYGIVSKAGRVASTTTSRDEQGVGRLVGRPCCKFATSLFVACGAPRCGTTAQRQEGTVHKWSENEKKKRNEKEQKTKGDCEFCRRNDRKMWIRGFC